MTTISEIAKAADVSVESVLRVLNRDKVSTDIESRVIAAMDAYGYGRLPRSETATAAQPDPPTGKPAGARASTRAVSGEIVEESRKPDFESNDAIRRAREQLLYAVGGVVDELENPSSVSQGSDNLAGIRHITDRMMVMEARLDRLAREVEGMKRELGRGRNERLEDLTLLVDLITTSWRAVDRRLGRVDRKLERMEGLPEPPGRYGGRSLGGGGSRRLP
jgi:Bacterial regulatory proteins, lacI family